MSLKIFMKIEDKDGNNIGPYISEGEQLTIGVLKENVAGQTKITSFERGLAADVDDGDGWGGGVHDDGITVTYRYNNTYVHLAGMMITNAVFNVELGFWFPNHKATTNLLSDKVGSVKQHRIIMENASVADVSLSGSFDGYLMVTLRLTAPQIKEDHMPSGSGIVIDHEHID